MSQRYQHWRDYPFEKLAKGPLYFYVGAGLSTGAGLAGWHEMTCAIWSYLKKFEDEHVARPVDDAPESERFLDDFVRQETGKKGVAILSRGAADVPEPRTLGRAVLLNLLLRYRGPRLQPTSDGPDRVERLRPGAEPLPEDLVIQSLIWRSRCHGVFTTNYDTLLEHAFSLFQHGAALRTYQYDADFLRFILTNRRFILKLHGDINDIASMQFCPGRAWSRKGALAGRRGQDLKKAYADALDRGHMVYLGCGLRDETIGQLHDAWEMKPSAKRYCRVALVLNTELNKHSDIHETARSSGNVGRIDLLPISDFREVREFMEAVVGLRSGTAPQRSYCSQAKRIHKSLFL